VLFKIRIFYVWWRISSGYQNLKDPALRSTYLFIYLFYKYTLLVLVMNLHQVRHITT